MPTRPRAARLWLIWWIDFFLSPRGLWPPSLGTPMLRLGYGAG
jgi:hypothetical protein